jgi:hypothetical protein
MELSRKQKRWGVGGLLAALVLVGVTTSGQRAAAAAPAAVDCAVSPHFLPGDFGGYVSDVAVAGPGDVWAVGGAGNGWQEYQGNSNGWPLIHHWTGTEWTSVTPPTLPAPETEGGLIGATAFGPDDVWAVGFTSPPANSGSPPLSHPLAVHWDGRNWQIVPTPDLLAMPGQLGELGLSAIDGWSPTDLWAVGAGILHGDGSHWAVAPVNGIPSGKRLALTSVAATSRDDAWAAGALWDPDPNMLPVGILLHWNGYSWDRADNTLPAGFEAQAVAAVRGQAGVWAVGKGAAHWDGQSWTAVPVPGLDQGLLTDVTVTAAGDAWATATQLGLPNSPSQGGVFHWDGHAWHLIPDASFYLRNPLSHLGGIAVEGPGDVWVGGSITTTTGHSSWSTGEMLHIFSPCVVPTVAAPDPHQAGVLYFPEVQHTLRGTFRAYWEAHGGLAQFGYPITEEYTEKSATDGRTYTVQYFQRNRFELHPENAGTPYEVLLGLLGRTVSAPLVPTQEAFKPLAAPAPGRVFFPPTGHSLAPEFADYWQAHGGLAVYGYPISEPFQETSPTDGNTYLVQYFERNRLEYHPELPTAFRVSLGLLGVDVLKARAWLP